MAVTGTLANYFRVALATGLIDLSADTIKCILMASGFTFDRDNHATKKNIKPTITASTISISGSPLALHDSGSGFETAGFLSGQSITISGFTESGNNDTFTIATIAAGTITLSDPTGMVAESSGDSVTISHDDELATGNGYTQGGVSLSGATVTQDDSGNKAVFTCDDITAVTASGGNVGPTPGAILFDDTESDDTIIGYIDFDGEQTVVSTHFLKITNAEIDI